jgi:CBS domain-containing protein
MNRDMSFDTDKTTNKVPNKSPKDFLGKADVICVDENANIIDAVNLMKENQIGDVVVVDNMDAKKPIGILTDRDIALKCAEKPDFESMTVADCMAKGIVTCREDVDVFDMISEMKKSGVGRLPLVNEQGALTKIVTAKNLFQCLTEGLIELVGISREQHKNEQQSPTTH